MYQRYGVVSLTQTHTHRETNKRCRDVFVLNCIPPPLPPSFLRRRPLLSPLNYFSGDTGFITPSDSKGNVL